MQLPLWASCDSWDCCWQTQLNQLTIILISKVALLRKWSYVSWRCAAAALRSTFITDKQKMLRFKGSVVNMEAVYSCQVKSVLKDGLQESASNQKGCCLRLKSLVWCDATNSITNCLKFVVWRHRGRLTGILYNDNTKKGRTGIVF